MKNILTILLVSVFSMTGFSQETVEKHMNDFSQIKTFDGLSVKLIKSDENKAIITGKHAKDVMFVNKKGMLKIRLTTPRTFNGFDTYISLYYKNIDLIDANEGSYVFSEEVVEVLDLEIKTQEGGTVELEVNAERLNIKAVTGGIVKLKGSANNQDVTVNSGGIYKAKECVTQQTKVSVSAGGIAKINATDIAKATVKAGGNIRIYGNPKLADTKEVLGGTITVVN